MPAPHWERILRKHGRMVWATAYRLHGRADDAEECMQDAFVSAVKLARRQKVRNWPAVLRHLATSRALDRLRTRSGQGVAVVVALAEGIAQLGNATG